MTPNRCHVLYNLFMTSICHLKAGKQSVHWLVLLSLLLGQFALGFGYGIAAEGGNDEIRIPVCTSTGIQYIVWTPDGIQQDTSSTAAPAAGNCDLCNAPPAQLRFDLQDSLLPSPQTSGPTVAHERAQLNWATFALNPRAAPRAPPFA